jgi:hypothetical protein
MKMSREEMLEYLKQFDGKFYKKENEEEIKAAVKKIESLLKKFGFTFHESFSMRCRDFSGKKKDTSWFWRFEIEKYKYIEIQIGYINKLSKTYGRGRTAKQYLQGYTGLCRVSNVSVSLNPETGEPWKIGDTVTHESGCYSVTLTKRGWYSGD